MSMEEVTNQTPTPGSRYNWIEIRNEYLTDPQCSYRKISEKYGPALQTIFERSEAENWQKEREKNLALIDQRVKANLTESAVQFQTEKLKIGKYVIGTSLKGMQEHKPKTFREAKEGMEVGYKIATEAMGLDKPSNQVNIQNNTYLSLTDFLTQMQKRKQEKLAYEEQTNI